MTTDVNDLIIKRVRGHFEVYVNGEFFCTTDSYIEAINEVFEAYR